MPSTIYLPTVFGPAPTPVAGQGDTGVMNARACAFALAWYDLLGERAKLMRIDERLCHAAQQQATWLASNDFDKSDPHLGENGSTANQRVRATGYKLPLWHLDGNTVESATHDLNPNIEEVVSGLMNHPTHHDHMWCVGFWEPNVCYGVGWANGFYVIVTAPEPVEEIYGAVE